MIIGHDDVLTFELSFLSSTIRNIYIENGVENIHIDIGVERVNARECLKYAEFSSAAFVIDLQKSPSSDLIWHGTSRDFVGCV